MDKNPNKKFADSDGIDLPVMYVYLAGRIAGNCIDKCLGWRHAIINHYKNYKPIYNYPKETIIKGDMSDFIVGYESYPIAFLDALNSKEADSIDAKGLTSALPSNLIYDKDLMSVNRADVIVANMNDYMEAGIEDLLGVLGQSQCSIEEIEGKVLDVLPDENGDLYYENKCEPVDFKEAFYKLQKVILNRRPNLGTTCEMSWALYLQKPLILIAKDEAQKEMLSKHPFTKRASVIVGSVEELLEGKWLNIIYKSISSAIY